MAFSNSDAEKWFRRFSMFPTRFGRFGEDDPFAELGKIFRNNFGDIERNIPKELMRQYETAGGDNLTELGPLVYGYSIVIGPDGKPGFKNLEI